MPDWLLFVLFLGLPLLIPTVGFWWLHRRAKSRSGQSLKFYHLAIGSSRIAISSDAVAKLALIAIPILWLDQFVPYVPLLVMLLAIYMVTRKTAETAVADSAQQTADVVKALQEM